MVALTPREPAAKESARHPGGTRGSGQFPGLQVLLRPPRPTQHPPIEVFSSQPVLESRPNPIRGHVTELVAR
jgi:hypothetical protein